MRPWFHGCNRPIREAFARVAEANPNDAAAHHHLGLNSNHKGLDDLAIGEFNHALPIDQSDRASESRAALAPTLAGAGAWNTGRYRGNPR